MEPTQVSTDRWMDKDVVYVDSGILLSHKKWMMAFAATCKEPEIFILNEVSQTKTNIWYHICGI